MLTITERLTWIVAQLRTALGVFAAREARPPQPVWIGATLYAPRVSAPALPVLPPEAWILFWNRLDRLLRRFHALHDRWRSNTLPAPRPPRPAKRPACPPAAPHPRTRHPSLPRAFAWVNRRIPESSPSSGQLHTLLAEPDTRALVEAAPQAGRLLRPLCRALGVRPPPWLALPTRLRKPHPRAPRVARPRRPSLNDPALRLQDYVIAAARAWSRRSA
jgi:hypothetical protein